MNVYAISISARREGPVSHIYARTAVAIRATSPREAIGKGIVLGKRIFLPTYGWEGHGVSVWDTESVVDDPETYPVKVCDTGNVATARNG